jgi:6-phosphogluconolactonase (cycloisomerase 2 family)
VLATRTDDDGLLAADDVASVPACVTPWDGGEGAPSHVALSVDGTRLYVGVRGPDVVATFAIEPDDASPARVRLTHLADSPLVGTWPRHFAVLDTAAGDVLVVAGQQSSTLEALRVRPRSGRAEHLASLALPSPACVVERRILEG